ncbi:MAG: BrxA/BrxB family bacilliredoxin [Bacteroidota bacterium]
MYPPELTAPMAAELVNAGFQELKNTDDVDNVLRQQEGTTLLMVNSVCGCAARAARPGVISAITSGVKPDRMVTVFAGVDHAATQKAREYLLPYPPSSPSVAIFKDGQLVHMIERHHIERATEQMLEAHLKATLADICQQPV